MAQVGGIGSYGQLLNYVQELQSEVQSEQSQQGGCSSSNPSSSSDSVDLSCSASCGCCSVSGDIGSVLSQDSTLSQAMQQMLQSQAA